MLWRKNTSPQRTQKKDQIQIQPDNTKSFKKHLLACLSSYSDISESLGLVLDGVNKMRVSEPDEERQIEKERKGEKEN